MPEQRRLICRTDGKHNPALALVAIPNVAEVISKPFSRGRETLSNFDKLWPERQQSQWPDLH
jgi:hypothetical protein